MNKNTTDMTAASYFHDLVIGFYEDESLVAEIGRTLGFDVEQDVFMAAAFFYPSEKVVCQEDRELLFDAAAKTAMLSERNRNMDSPQIMTCDKGVCVMLIAESKAAMQEVLKKVRETVPAQIQALGIDEHVRVGIGTVESGIRGIENTFRNASEAVRAGEIFKKDRVLLEYMGMEIYSSINQMVISYGSRLTRTVWSSLSDREKKVLSAYYKCKEESSRTAGQLGMTKQQVEESLRQVQRDTGLDVRDTEDNFKLHFIVIARKILEHDERMRRGR